MPDSDVPEVKKTDVSQLLSSTKTLKNLKTTVRLPKRDEISHDKPTAEKIEENPLQEIGNDPFTPEDLQALWDEYIVLKKGEGIRDSEMLVLRQPWEIDESYTITLKLSNTIQQDILDRLQTGLVGHFRRALNNRQISLRGSYVAEEQEKLLYTNREKFDYLCEIKPEVRTLAERLGLDPDF
ncbi:MAG: hypothetical protein OEX02_19695 [Cyclobacteriaceae bacterium]|nr:hypothetical protein [Cyclobacteriaceae bacterium]